MKQQQHRHTGQNEAQTLTKAVTHIRLDAANAGKLAALDALAEVYLLLCQQYVTLFCSEEQPDKFRATCFTTSLSERWHRVAVQQAAGIAQFGAPIVRKPTRITWRTSRSTVNNWHNLNLTRMQKSQYGRNGTSRYCDRSVSRPMSTLWRWNPRRIPPLTTGYASALLSGITPSGSRSSWQPITAKHSLARLSIPASCSTSGAAIGG